MLFKYTWVKTKLFTAPASQTWRSIHQEKYNTWTICYNLSPISDIRREVKTYPQILCPGQLMHFCWICAQKQQNLWSSNLMISNYGGYSETIPLHWGLKRYVFPTPTWILCVTPVPREYACLFLSHCDTISTPISTTGLILVLTLLSSWSQRDMFGLGWNLISDSGQKPVSEH